MKGGQQDGCLSEASSRPAGFHLVGRGDPKGKAGVEVKDIGNKKVRGHG
jgi:hypothetical protein